MLARLAGAFAAGALAAFAAIRTHRTTEGATGHGANSGLTILSPTQLSIPDWAAGERAGYANAGTVRLVLDSLDLANLSRTVKLHAPRSADDDPDDGLDGAETGDDSAPPPSNGNSTLLDLDSTLAATNPGLNQRVKIRIAVDAKKFEFRDIVPGSPVAAADTASQNLLRQVGQPREVGSGTAKHYWVIRFWVLNKAGGTSSAATHFNFGLTVKEKRTVGSVVRKYRLPVIIDPAIRNRG